MEVLENQDVKKKRGRRPKSDKIVVLEPETTEKVEKDNTEVKGKRGRKPKYVYNAFEATSPPNNSTLSDDENIIVKLNIQNTIQTKEEDQRIIDDQPYAYNCSDYLNNNLNELDDSVQDTINENDKQIMDIRVLELLKDFEEKNKNNEWPTNTSISCYWCCHRFNNAPFGIPINYFNERFEVYGCFCSLECASAYNFKKTDNIDEMWERYNLINLMCRKMNIGTFVKPAPDILSLKIFGGHLDIDKFREYFKTNRVITLNFPPMTSITQQLEEINEYELNNEYKYIPIDNDRINRYKEKILFKRNKPLINNSNSLESSMKLTYH
jgi:hypothetical protein